MAPRVRRSPPWGRISRALAAAVPVGIALIAAAPREASAETIEAALARAYEDNPQLNAQRAIVRQTDEGVPQALSGYRPTITANASGRAGVYRIPRSIIPPTPGFVPNGAAFADEAWRHRIRWRDRLADILQRRTNREQGPGGGEQGLRGARDAAHDGTIGVAGGGDGLHGRVARQRQSQVQQNNVRVLQRTLTDTRNRFTAGQVTIDRRRAVGGAIGGGRSHDARRGSDADDDACQLPAHHRHRAGGPHAGIVGRSLRALDFDRLDRGRHRKIRRPSPPRYTASTLRSCRSRLPKARCGRH